MPIHSVRLPGLVAHQEVIFGGARRDAHDPPRLAQPRVVHARRAARGPPRGRARRVAGDRARAPAVSPACAARSRPTRRGDRRRATCARGEHAYRRVPRPERHAWRERDDGRERTERWRARILTTARARPGARGRGPDRGLATVGGARDDDAGPAAGELYALYVDPPAQGAGAGTRLLADAERRLRERGLPARRRSGRSATTASRTAFYERHGWVLDDAAPPPRSASAGRPRSATGARSAGAGADVVASGR